MWLDEIFIILTLTEIALSKSYQNFPAGFFPCNDLIALMQRSFGFNDDNGCFVRFLLNHYRCRCGRIR